MKKIVFSRLCRCSSPAKIYNKFLVGEEHQRGRGYSANVKQLHYYLCGIKSLTYPHPMAKKSNHTSHHSGCRKTESTSRRMSSRSAFDSIWATLWTISFSFRQNSLLSRMVLGKGNAGITMAGCNSKSKGRSNTRDVTCTHIKSPFSLQASSDTITAGLSLVCDKSVYGNETRTTSPWWYMLCYFLRCANTSSQRASSGLFQSSANEASEAMVYGSMVLLTFTVSPISSATRTSSSILSRSPWVIVMMDCIRLKVLQFSNSWKSTSESVGYHLAFWLYRPHIKYKKLNPLTLSITL